MSNENVDDEIEATAEQLRRARLALVDSILALEGASHEAKHRALCSFARRVLGFDLLVVVSGEMEDEDNGYRSMLVESTLDYGDGIEPTLPALVARLRAIASRIEANLPSGLSEVTIINMEKPPRGQAS